MKKCGIYCIRNMTNNKMYVGSSNDIHRRWRCHKNKLRDVTHGNPYLQNSWNKHGEDEFEFYVLEECVESKLIEREDFHIAKHKTLDKNYGYNLTDAKRLNITTSVRKNMSKAKLNMTDEQKKQWASRSKTRFKKGAKPHNKGKSGEKASKETKEKMSKSHKKRYLNSEERKKTSEASKKRYLDPSEKARHSKRMKLWWAERKLINKEA